ncbi:MAG: DUF362 domain-containing protein [Candidatus Eisenbacteria bacterium]|uniref:DUF362 domain-containing protein n=1 Tax=Eiseniibacteriota bacterium TaxID=2212470 RepID=A0A948RXE5_UNCEI|nr:DUF362 domain-containing protein [Candidatus Eisenbacteria bacterium]MBU1947118.1 DUF362 domain-containing protein [Candidatus Eisenbacteria bacterium]MBU2691364.1 DUF362 domain-containing protein [Candidatus Eisenbacteria bacterium]
MTKRAKVAVLFTSRHSIMDDFSRLMGLAEVEKYLPKEHEISLKINISWHKYYPACSTTPWQLDGVIRGLLRRGYDPGKIHAAQNSTVVVDTRIGEVENRLKPVLDHHKIPSVYLNDDDTEWIPYEPKTPLLVLDKVYKKRGIRIPRALIGSSVIHLPTVKTHVFTTMTGAMKNAFGGLLNFERHWTHAVIHETLVDLLTIQQDIHPGIFAVMDGTIAGEGPGPRAMFPREKNVILASGDSVAIDAISAKLQGFDPMAIDCIRLAHEKGLGVGDTQEIEIVGDDIKGVNFNFTGGDTFASRGQKLIYHGWLKPLEHLLLRTPIVPWSYAASRLYHDAYWFNAIGKKRINALGDSQWLQLFEAYKNGPPDLS